MSYHVSEEILKIARQGEKVRAIALLREQNGLGLAQAKNLLEETLENAPTSPIQPLTPQVVMDEIDLALARGEKLQAIKLLCDITGVSLLEAKERIEIRMETAQPSSSSKSQTQAKTQSSHSPGEVTHRSAWPVIALLIAAAMAAAVWYYFSKR